MAVVNDGLPRPVSSRALRFGGGLRAGGAWLGAAALLGALAGCGPQSADRSEATADPAPPTFGELQDQIWESSLSADSVTVDAEVSAADIGAENFIGDEDSQQKGSLTAAGALDGTNTQVRFSVGEVGVTQRVADGAEYYGGEEFGAMLASQLDPELAAEVDQDVIDRAVGGEWVEYPSGGARALVAAEDILTALQRDLEDSDWDEHPAEETVRDDQEVYVFSALSEADGKLEIVVAAQGPPYVLSVQDDEAAYTFSDWDETDPPGSPDAALTPEDVSAAIAEDKGWPAEDVE